MSEPGTGVAYAVGPTARPPVAPLARAAQDSLARANRALLIVGCLVVLSISHGVDADLWGHVRYGQDELAARALPSTATTPTRRWGTPGSTTRTWPSSRSAGSKPTWGRPAST